MLLIGAGAAEALGVSGPGTILAVYRRAAYLRLPGGIVALVGPDVPPGPLWIQVRQLHGDLRPGGPATAGAGWLQVAGRRLSMAGRAIWRGDVPHPGELQSSRCLAEEVLASAPPSALLSDPWHDAFDRAEAALRGDDLLAVVRLLGGLGPGLTPAGDDALAGILLARRALEGEAAEAGLIGVAGTARTTELSAALLRWAARGQAAEPVHTLLAALAAGERTAGLAAAGRIASLGASSGADLLLGLRLGLRRHLGAAGTQGGRKP